VLFRSLPTSDWRVIPEILAKPFRHFVSPDGTTFLPVGQDFLEGATSWGIKSASQIRGFSLAPVAPGKPFYITDEAQLRTWTGTVGTDGSLTGLKVFVEQGGEGTAVDAEGNVYIAAGQIYVYNPAGKLIDTIEVPERPLQLAFGGKDGHTLFISARSSLYAIRTLHKGR
jgi:DNA-binding beta-propeller fold protein YncE